MKYALLSPLDLIVNPLEGSPLPIELELVKSHCAVDGTDLDTLLTTYTRAAIIWAEGFTHRTIFRRGHVWVLSNFPQCEPYRFQLPRGLTRSVDAVRYYDGAHALQLLSGPTGSPVGTGYQEDLRSEAGGVLAPTAGESWPDADSQAIAPVSIEFDAGWDAGAVPEEIVQAILFAVSDMLETRGQADQGGNFTTRQALLSPWMLSRWYA